MTSLDEIARVAVAIDDLVTELRWERNAGLVSHAAAMAALGHIHGMTQLLNDVADLVAAEQQLTPDG